MNLEYKLKMALQSNSEEKINNIFEEIYLCYGKLVFFCISKYIDNTMDIEELTNDVFINFFNQLEKVKEFKSIKYYLVSSAKNASLNFLKKKRIETVTIDESLICDHEKSSFIYNDIIRQMEIVLNHQEIEIIISHQIYGLSFRDIAEEMQISVNTIKSIYRRALKKISKKYQGGKKDE